MKEIKVVIGKNFGDEGKGQTVSLLCERENTVVVRHNGGAQAGHTVEEGAFLFVYHQLGSGSHKNCATYWSHTFLPDLVKLGEEAEELDAEMVRHFGRHYSGVLYAHEDCRCTTVYDVLLNRITEELRGEKKHGSCGMGIYETVLRSRKEEYVLRLRDLKGADKEQIADLLKNIRDGYVRERLAELRRSCPGEFAEAGIAEWMELMESDELLFYTAETICENFNKYIRLSDWEQIKNQFDTVIFENAQGLLLDEENAEYFPHLTPSRTGLANVAELLLPCGSLCRKHGYAGDGTASSGEAGRLRSENAVPVEVIYVSRTYVTRHGAGRLDHECTKEEIDPGICDVTNGKNPWQGSLRFAKHPAGEAFVRYMRQDGKRLGDYAGLVQYTLLFTHPNETAEKILFADGAKALSEVTAVLAETGLKMQVKVMRPVGQNRGREGGSKAAYEPGNRSFYIAWK